MQIRSKQALLRTLENPEKICLTTDCSGKGCVSPGDGLCFGAESVVGRVEHTPASLAEEVVSWRASDIDETCQQVLCSFEGSVAPRHVTGDIRTVDSTRLGPEMCTSLQELLARRQQQQGVPDNDDRYGEVVKEAQTQALKCRQMCALLPGPDAAFYVVAAGYCCQAWRLEHHIQEEERVA